MKETKFRSILNTEASTGTTIEPKADERRKEWRKPNRVDTPGQITEPPKIAEIETDTPVPYPKASDRKN